MLGLVFGVALLLYARSYREKGEKLILAKALVIAAAIYVLFALIWGNTTWLVIETAGMPLYGFFAWASVRYSAYWLAIGWLLHPLWDVWLHLLGPGATVAPEWYAVACITFDILVASYIFYRVKFWRQNIKKV